MKKKFLSALLATCLCINVPMQVNAAEVEYTPNAYSNETGISPMAAGLITYSLVTCSASTKTINITALVNASERMGKLGFKNIVIQRSSDKKTWTTEVTLSDKIGEDVLSYSINNYAVKVKGGYYYRVKLTNYAKEKTWFFPDSQSVEGISSSVWIA